jgi:hypothetical protein
MSFFKKPFRGLTTNQTASMILIQQQKSVDEHV